MSATGRARDGGTTLIEALVVVAITVLVSLVAFPRLQQALVTLSQRQTASVVAESRPPDSNTMARAPAVTSLTGHIAPQDLVKLHLKTYG